MFKNIKVKSIKRSSYNLPFITFPLKHLHNVSTNSKATLDKFLTCGSSAVFKVFGKTGIIPIKYWLFCLQEEDKSHYHVALRGCITLIF